MRIAFVVLVAALTAATPITATATDCIACHKKKTPQIYQDWKASAHAKKGIQCQVCHGSAHDKASNADKAGIPTPDTCKMCHAKQVEQFSKGKHALAWTAMKAMPTWHWQPQALMEGQKGCGGCHKIGLKLPQEIKELRKKGQGYGTASCDACHTRHLFSKKEARQPEACRTCHMGMDHPQFEMYSSSKHGVRHQLKRAKILPKTAAAPSCVTCHMQNGDHENHTPWGFLAVRLPMPQDKQWAADRATILQALGILDPKGKPTARLELVKKSKVARLTQMEWDKGRNKMLKACAKCHSTKFARGELAKGDRMIREADKLMAAAIRIIAGLYQEGLLKKPKNYAHAFPDLLTFHDTPTQIENRLHMMFLKHRMRAFQGTFHMNPYYAFWYGWAEMRRDLQAIKEGATRIRKASSE